MMSRKGWIITAITVIGVALAFVVGYLVRRSVHKPECGSSSSSTTSKSMAQRQQDWEAIVKNIKAENIDANLKYGNYFIIHSFIYYFNLLFRIHKLGANSLSH